MALMKSVVISNDDELPASLEFYLENIVFANDMKKILGVRLYLLKARNARQSYPSHLRDSPHNIQVTKLEIGLMEAADTLQKVVMDRQLLHIALQKCIHSTMLHISQKNLFGTIRLNYVEREVAQQMKLMLKSSDAMCNLKEINDQHVTDISSDEDALMGRVTYQQERVNQTEDSVVPEDRAAQINALHRKIDQINKLRTLIDVILSNNIAQLQPEISRKLIFEAVKWRTPRSFSYYKNLCSSRRV